jgi:hypothetical protein
MMESSKAKYARFCPTCGANDSHRMRIITLLESGHGITCHGQVLHPQLRVDIGTVVPSVVLAMLEEGRLQIISDLINEVEIA